LKLEAVHSWIEGLLTPLLLSSPLEFRQEIGTQHRLFSCPRKDNPLRAQKSHYTSWTESQKANGKRKLLSRNSLRKHFHDTITPRGLIVAEIKGISGMTPAEIAFFAGKTIHSLHAATVSEPVMRYSIASRRAS
jgi:hypothetical protein